MAGPRVWPEGNPSSTGPGKIPQQVGYHRAGCRRAARLVAAGQFAKDHRGGPGQQACEAKLREEPVKPVRPFANFIEKQNMTGRRVEGERRRERRGQHRQVTAVERPGSLAAPDRLEARRRQLAERLAAAEGAHERPPVVSLLAEAEPSGDVWAVKTHRPARHETNARIEVTSLYPTTGLRAARTSAASKKGSIWTLP